MCYNTVDNVFWGGTVLDYLLLFLVVLCVSAQQVTQKAYNGKANRGGFTFSALSALFAALFFLATSLGHLEFRPEVIPYSLLFALSYGTAMIGIFFAIKTGPLSLSSLLLSYSLIIPTLYGLFFLGDEVDALLIAGLAVLAVSLFLVNYERKSEEKRITLRWILFVLLAFFGNGFCSVVQKIQQDRFEGAYKNEFMIPALLIVFLTFAVFALFTERERILPSVKGGWFWSLACGICNGLANLLVMLLTATLPASVMFPLISAGGIVLSYLVARFLYREKLNVLQNIGVLLGVAAVVLLNL